MPDWAFIVVPVALVLLIMRIVRLTAEDPSRIDREG
jgi:hypothetical protein